MVSTFRRFFMRTAVSGGDEALKPLQVPKLDGNHFTEKFRVNVTFSWSGMLLYFFPQ
ncbi:hypothetical protein Syun_012316 [Stephania yunnanensis]|uniref:Uncharacterized protein n=1 Tax=Stephania yunnanensis TaxID=152371 RepID=A0AAP0PJD2_9MAGN